jgi:ATP-dependent Clp protease ATP-binding subunit ClpC
MDNRGKVLHFENSMIFFTSNIGYSEQRQGGGPLGFGDEESRERAGRQDIEGQIRKGLAPEFVNRVHLIHFRHLNREAVDEIFDLEIAKIRKRYRLAQGIDVRVTDEARRELLDRGYNRDFGARNLAKVLNRFVNIEVSKVLKRDQERKMGDVMPALAVIREMREGKREFDQAEVTAVVEDCSRLRVPYSRLTVDFRQGDFDYLRG